MSDETAAPTVTALPYTLGIDLGSNVTRLAMLDAATKMPKILRNDLANESTPTSIAFVSEEARTFGDNAVHKEVSKPQSAVGDLVDWVRHAPGETRTVGDVEDLSAAGAAAYYLQNMLTFVPKDQLASAKVCISAYPGSSSGSLEVLKSAAVVAGVQAERVLLVDSTEAIVAYMHHLQRASLPTGDAAPLSVVVVDVGKCTTTVVVAKLTADKAVILASRSIAVGSSALDIGIANHVFTQVEAKHKGSDIRGHSKSFQKILRESRKAKEMLSSVDSARVQVEGLKDDIDVNEQVTRRDLDAIAASFVERLTATVREAVEVSGVTPSNGEELRVEAVGAGWRNVCLMDAIKSATGASRIGVSLDGNMAVAEGCSIVGACVETQAAPTAEGRDAIHSVALEGFVSLARSVSTLDASTTASLIDDENKRREADEVIHTRIRAINALDSFVLQTLEASYHCTPDSKRQDALREALQADEEYVRDDCNGDDVTVIAARLADVQQRIADQFPEIKAHYEAKQEEERKKEAELKRLSEEAQSEVKELKSDPQRLRAAQQRREQGQSLFKQEHWGEAQTRFVQALSILGELYDLKDEANKAKKDEISLSCHLNIASCSIKLSMWRNALNNAKSALDLSPNNAKALFRRGQAAGMLNDYASARADLELAKELTNGDAGVVAELESVISREAAEKAKEKKMFSRMFS